jgi:hypothetical protein
MSRLNLFTAFCGVFLCLSGVFCSPASALSPSPALHAQCVTFSPDGSLIAAAALPQWNERPKGARVWTVATGQIYRNYPWAQDDWLAFSPDGRLLALSDGKFINLVTLSSNIIDQKLDTTISIEKFWFSPDGQWLLVQSPLKADETGDYEVEIWHLGKTPTKTTRRLTRASHDVHYLPTGPTFMPANSLESAPILCDKTAAAEPGAWLKAFSPDGQWQALMRKDSSTLQVWNTKTCEVKYAPSLIPPVDPEARGKIQDIWFSPKSRWLLGPRFRGDIYLDLTDGSQRTFIHDSGLYRPSITPVPDARSPWPLHYAFSPDENFLAITRGISYFPGLKENEKPYLILYDLRDGQRLRTFL